MPLTLDQLNAASPQEALQWLSGVYEHSPWIAQQVLAQRPFRSQAQLQYAMVCVVRNAGLDAQLALIRAHPPLAAKFLASTILTAESTLEQGRAGLNDCTAQEHGLLTQLNADYSARFGFPFILAVRGPRGTGLSPAEIIATFARRIENHADFERAEALRNIHRIAEIRLNDKLMSEPEQGNAVWDWHEALAQHSDPDFAQRGELAVTYLTAAHRACAQDIALRMRECGFDEIEIDAVGNVVGRYHSATPGARSLLTGSHYDTVRNGGKYDGRLGIFVPMACVREMHGAKRRLPFGIELVAFAEEEGQRYKATFLGSSALIGQFNFTWLDQVDADGIPLRSAMQAAGLRIEDIATIQRDPARYIGFVEVHIEQGPVLNELDIPLGVVTSINGCARYVCEMIGTASHAGTTPMDRRRDAAVAVAELALYMERRAAQDEGSVGTMGQLHVPGGSINVVPGRCQFSLDLRAPTDAQRDALVRDVFDQLDHIAGRRGLRYSADESMRAAAAPCAPFLQHHWGKAVEKLGLPLCRLPSGAGHDAMKLHAIMPQAMLFVRGQNAGISHNPLESTTNNDIQRAVDAFTELLVGLSEKQHEYL